MKRMLKQVALCMLVAVFFWFGTLIADRQKLEQELIRLHVVAASDSDADQAVKLRVRDAIAESIQADLAKIGNVEAAKEYIQENLTKLSMIANRVLEENGMEPSAVVTFCKEAMDTRVYDTFSLPAGIYNALRVTIGAGEGKNWWCVVFPTLCVPATTEEFAAVAVDSGMSQTLCDTLTGASGYEIRFYLLDAVGRLENMLLGE